MAHGWIVGVALPLMAGLLYAEKRDSLVGRLCTKTPLSLLFVAAVFLQPDSDAGYFQWLAAGLVLCAIGDVLLAVGDLRTFRWGLGAFLLGHLCYTPAFWGIGEFGWSAAATAGVAFGMGISVYRWLLPNLGSMRIPVTAYIVVISAMLCTASMVAGAKALPVAGRAMVGGGALLFYLSDLFVARQRFVTPSFANRLFGLPLYYTGQFLLAYSVGFF
ncbi:MAG: lysoplasmalogenase [Desulfobacteraceae bacterium]|nr:lysoplasmalogenase [Desulfobacteraceae bacterium]